MSKGLSQALRIDGRRATPKARASTNVAINDSSEMSRDNKSVTSKWVSRSAAEEHRSGLRGFGADGAGVVVRRGSNGPFPDFPALRGMRRGVGGAERGSEALEEALLLTVACQRT